MESQRLKLALLEVVSLAETTVEWGQELWPAAQLLEPLVWLQVGGVLLGDITFPREAGRMDGVLATALVVGATLDGGGRTDWIHVMSVSLVPVAGTPSREQYRCS